MVKRGTPGRRRPGLSRERIAAAAVEFVDRHGIEAFGVRRLAAELKVDPMSIYNHIPGKAALLDAISEVVVTEATAGSTNSLTAPSGDWQEVARSIAHGYRDMAMRHPRVFPLLATRSQQSPVALAVLERLTLAMRSGGLDEQVVADVPLILFGFLNGYLLAVLSPGNPAMAEAVAALDPAAYPAMASVAPFALDYGSAEQFDRMLEVVLAGIRARAETGGVEPSLPAA
jgi:AcrR family transcriptional regulator